LFSSSILNLLAERNAISIPEKKATKIREVMMMMVVSCGLYRKSMQKGLE